MNAESLAILGELFRNDIAITTNFDADQLRRENSLNIAQNILLAIKRQRHPRLSGAQSTEREENMAKKTSGHKKEGRFAFVKSLIKEGTLTYDQIVAAAKAKFPEWDAKLVAAGVYSSRTQMRKAGDSVSNWQPPVPVTKSEPQNTITDVPESAVEKCSESVPHITQPTEAQAA